MKHQPSDKFSFVNMLLLELDYLYYLSAGFILLVAVITPFYWILPKLGFEFLWNGYSDIEWYWPFIKYLFLPYVCMY